MASFFNMKGTTQNEFQVGIKGPIISRDTTNGILNLPNSSIEKLFLGSSYDSDKYLTASQYTGNSATATKLATVRTISLKDGAVGSANFDGSDNISISISKLAGSYINWDSTNIPYSSLPTGSTSATVATGDHNHDLTYLKLSGGTLTGDLTINTALYVPQINTDSTSTAVYINTGTNANSYFQCRKFRGQGTASTYNHAVDFGYAGHDRVDFYEYGGVYNFWKNTGSTKLEGDANRVASLQLGKLVERGNTLTYPNKSGTLALTSDLETKQDTLTNDQLTVLTNGVTSITDAGSGAKITKFGVADNTITVTREALVASDIPNIDASKITSGTVAIARLPYTTSIGSASTDTSIATAKSVYTYASPKAGSSSLTTYSGGTLAAAAAKGVTTSISSTSTDDGLATGKAVYNFVTSKLTGVYTFKGTITKVTTDNNGKITPVITSGDSTIYNINGYIYNVSESFTYLGETYPAGTNIVYEDESNDDEENGIWKPLGGSFDIDLSNYQKADADLTAIATLTGTSGLLRKTAADKWELDTANYAGSSSKGGSANSVKCFNATADKTRYIYIADSSASDTDAILGYSNNFTYNPVSGKVTATEFVGKLTGNASTATLADAAKKLNTAVNFTIGSATAKSFDGTTDLSWALSDIGAAASSHTHGNVTNDGKLQANDITIANGDKLIVTDSSDSSKIARTSLSFDGSTTNRFLSKKGTWEAAGTVNSVTIKGGDGISVDDTTAIVSGGIRTISNTGVLKVGSRTGNITIDNLKTDLGLGSRAYDSTAYLPLTGGVITGSVTLNNCNTYTTPSNSLSIRRNSNDMEKISINLDDQNTYFKYTNDETVSNIFFILENTDSEKSTDDDVDDSSTNAVQFQSGKDTMNIILYKNYGSSSKSESRVLTSTNFSSWASPLKGSSSLTTYSGGTLAAAAAKGVTTSISSSSTDNDLPTTKAVYNYASPKAGSSSITTVGTITSGTWNGSAIGKTYLPNTVVYTDDTQTIKNKTFIDSKYNGLTLTAATTGFTIAGGTTSKTLTVNENYTLGAACAKGVSTSISSSSTDSDLSTAKAVYNYATTNFAPKSHTHSYLPLTGSGSSTTTADPTNVLTGNIWFKNTDGIKINSNDSDLKIWEVVGNSGSYASQYGFYEKYNGTNTFNNNSLTLYADNMSGAHTLVRTILQDGTVTWSTNNTFNNNVTVASVNNIKLTAATTGFTIAGGTTSKTLTVNENYTLGAACAKGVSTSISSSSTDSDLATSKSVYSYAAPKSHTHNITKLVVNDIRSLNNTPDNFENKTASFWFSNINTPTSTWYGGINVCGWNNNENYQQWQIASSSTTGFSDGRLYYRNSASQTTWHEWHTLAYLADITASQVGLGNVENTKLSTWAGSRNITTVGTITSGTWNGSAIGKTYLPNTVVYTDDTQTIKNKTFIDSKYNGLTLTAATTGFTIAGGTTSKTLTVNENYTLGAACAKGVITSGDNITSTATNLPTGQAVYNFVAKQVASAVQYLGTVNNTSSDALLWSTKLVHSTSNIIGKGDFFRATAAFTLTAGTTNTKSSSVHAGDIIIALVDAPSAANTDNYVVSHVEIDTNTWTANSSSAAGYVASGSGQTSKVWKTDASGNPAWRDDANTTYTLTVSGTQIKLTPSSGSANTITVPYATSAANATKATQDGNGNVITTTYATVSSLPGVIR